MWRDRSAAARRAVAEMRRQLAEQRYYAEAGEWIARQPSNVLGYGKDDARAVLDVIHPIGKGLLSAFGAGGIADAAENLEVHYGVLTPTKPTAQKSASPSPPFTQPQGKMPGAASTTTKRPQELKLQPTAIDWVKKHPVIAAAGTAGFLWAVISIVRVR